MTREAAEPARLLFLFGAAALGAVGVGALVCAVSGVPTGLWARNLAAWLVGALLAVGVSAVVGPRTAQHLPWGAAIALAATFLAPGQDGVHRWISAGPATINVAMFVLPAAVVALAAAPTPTRWTWLSGLLCLALLVLQPDASQATAFGLALAFVANARASGRAARATLVAASLALAAVAWLRPDPLLPVPEVEEIVELAARRSVFLAALAMGLLAVAAAAPALALRRAPPQVRLAGGALSVCLALWAVTPFLGAYPVPLVGVGLSPILGAWIGVGLLAGLMRQPAWRISPAGP
jgi:hypothetical protein